MDKHLGPMANPASKHGPVPGISPGRLESAMRRAWWPVLAVGLGVFITQMCFINQPKPAVLFAATNSIGIVALGTNFLLFGAILFVSKLPPTRRELTLGYTTVYSRWVRDVDLIDWKTGAIIVPAGSIPPSLREVNARVRAARRSGIGAVWRPEEEVPRVEPRAPSESVAPGQSGSAGARRPGISVPVSPKVSPPKPGPSGRKDSWDIWNI